MAVRAPLRYRQRGRVSQSRASRGCLGRDGAAPGDAVRGDGLRVGSWPDLNVRGKSLRDGGTGCGAAGAVSGGAGVQQGLEPPRRLLVPRCLRPAARAPAHLHRLRLDLVVGRDQQSARRQGFVTAFPELAAQPVPPELSVRKRAARVSRQRRELPLTEARTAAQRRQPAAQGTALLPHVFGVRPSGIQAPSRVCAAHRIAGQSGAAGVIPGPPRLHPVAHLRRYRVSGVRWPASLGVRSRQSHGPSG